MLKMLGLGLIIGACSAIGMSMGRDLKRRVAQLQELRRMTGMLQGEIQYAKSPLSEAFRHAAARLKEPFSAFLRHTAEDMEQFSGEPFSEIFARNAGEELKDSGLLKEDLEQLCGFGEHLGYLDQQMQLRTIDLYRMQISETCEQAAEELKNKEKVYRYLGVCTGLFLAILFV